MRRSRRRILGQHFLVNQDVLDRMVDYAELSRSDVVLEAGAGSGALTRRLAGRAGKVIAVEIDEMFAEDLEAVSEAYPNVEVLFGDVLRLRPSGFNKVVSNPPYSISSRLIEWLVEQLPELMILTLQREFASKLAAPPGSPKYLYISAISSLYYENRILEIVPRTLFNPPPKVDSAIISMRRRNMAPRLGSSCKLLWKRLFTRRRQVLRRVLADLSGNGLLPASLVEELPEALASKRIFQLSPGELLDLCGFLGLSEEA
jgi:16S rRNA (adenine1518-N6/adenine1519-N6)-dimethyltransferase